MAKELKLAGAVTLETLVRAPGVLQTDEELSDTETFWPSVGKALKKALDALMKMRAREGTHLAKDLGKRIATARRSVERVQKQAPEVVRRYQEQLRERIKNAGLVLISSSNSWRKSNAESENLSTKFCPSPLPKATRYWAPTCAANWKKRHNTGTAKRRSPLHRPTPKSRRH